jgi:hypothetical protein
MKDTLEVIQNDLAEKMRQTLPGVIVTAEQSRGEGLRQSG